MGYARVQHVKVSALCCIVFFAFSSSLFHCCISKVAGTMSTIDDDRAMMIELIVIYDPNLTFEQVTLAN